MQLCNLSRRLARVVALLALAWLPATAFANDAAPAQRPPRPKALIYTPLVAHDAGPLSEAVANEVKLFNADSSRSFAASVFWNSNKTVETALYEQFAKYPRAALLMSSVLAYSQSAPAVPLGNALRLTELQRCHGKAEGERDALLSRTGELARSIDPRIVSLADLGPILFATELTEVTPEALAGKPFVLFEEDRTASSALSSIGLRPIAFDIGILETEARSGTSVGYYVGSGVAFEHGFFRAPNDGARAVPATVPIVQRRWSRFVSVNSATGVILANEVLRQAPYSRDLKYLADRLTKAVARESWRAHRKVKSNDVLTEIELDPRVEAALRDWEKGWVDGGISSCPRCDERVWRRLYDQCPQGATP
jgi:hypothetical protein